MPVPSIMEMTIALTRDVAIQQAGNHLARSLGQRLLIYGPLSLDEGRDAHFAEQRRQPLCPCIVSRDTTSSTKHVFSGNKSTTDNLDKVERNMRRLCKTPSLDQHLYAIRHGFTQYNILLLRNEKTSAVRSRISSKLIFASYVACFDRAYYGFYVTSLRMFSPH